VETILYDEPTANFDYFDFIVFGDFKIQRLNLVLCIRVKQFGIICIFKDNGFQKLHFQDLFDEYKGIPLHPIQFLEYSCKAAYKNSLLRFKPLYHSITNEDPWSDITVMPANYPQGKIWDTWDNNVYAALFCSMAEAYGFNVPSYENFVVGNKVVTYLNDGLGNPLIMTKYHVPGVKK